MNNIIKKLLKTVLIMAVIFILLCNSSYCLGIKYTSPTGNKYTERILNNEVTLEEYTSMNDKEKEEFQKGYEEAKEKAGQVIEMFMNRDKFKEQVKKEGGSFFERIIAECIAGIAQAVFDFTSSDITNVGFKNYDKLIFNKGISDESLSPFSQELWNKTMQWYSVFAIIAGILIFIAVIILAFKMLSAGVNPARRNDVKDSFMRLGFGALAIALAPLFIRVLIFLNNSLVNMLVGSAQGSLEDSLGENMISSILTGNPIATALVIALFVYLYIKINIKFIVRQFTIIIFTIFTPIAAGLWIINRNTTAVAIWAGQIIINIFMQFIYCFLFMVYMAFLPSSGGWAISIIWAMMILPLADTLQNCLQNLTSRIAGLDNEQVTSRGIGLGATIGYGLSAIAQQFKTPQTNYGQTNTNDNDSNSSGGGFFSRVKNVINPTMNLSPEKDYNGNTNPIRNVLPNEKSNIANNSNSNTNSSVGSKVGNALKTTAKIGGTYLGIGATMAGDKETLRNPYSNFYKKKAQTTEHIESSKVQEGAKDE
ncbi:MAG: hypothetical protein J6I85_02795 [Clostridia bacterium]|nr:hypothetical protein [Clostridia bacterium]MBP3800948.1 hypothetical protein [Clostridia bacterium]